MLPEAAELRIGRARYRADLARNRLIANHAYRVSMRTSSSPISIATAKTITIAEPASTRAAMRSITGPPLRLCYPHGENHAVADRAALVPAEELDVSHEPEADRDNASFRWRGAALIYTKSP